MMIEEPQTPLPEAGRRSIRRRRHTDPQQGLAFALASLATAAFLYFSPQYLSNVALSQYISLFFTFLGIVGLGTEINRLIGEEKRMGFDDLSIGAAIGGLWIVVYPLSTSLWLRLPMLLVFFMAVSGATHGCIKISANILKSGDTPRKTFIKFLVFVAQLTAFAAAILQSLQILHYIK